MGRQAASCRDRAGWDILKALAVIAIAALFYVGCLGAVATWIHPAAQSVQITIHFDRPLIVTTPSR